MYIYKIYIFFIHVEDIIIKDDKLYILKITLKYLFLPLIYIYIYIFLFFLEFLLIFTSSIFCVKISVDMSLIYPIYP